MRCLTIVLAATTLSCNAVTATPTPSPTDAAPALGNVFPVPWSQQHFGEIVVFVRDDTGLVTDATKLDGPLAGRGDLDAEALPETKQLDVTWIGGVCRFGPTVTLTGDAEQLLVTIDPTAGEQLPPGIACNDLGMFYGVTLDLTVPVDQSSVEVQSYR